MSAMMPITAVASVGMTVANMDRSIDFYTTVLNFGVISDRAIAGVELDALPDPLSARLYGLSNVRSRVVKLQLGDEIIELTEFLTPQGRPIPPDSRSNDLWFQHIAIVVSDMDRAYQHLCQHQVTQTSPSPQTLPDWNPVAGGIKSFYFKDPDGHNLELIQFPTGKGDPEWQGTDLLFLGIDHTAIVVADTAASRAFYGNLLGMKLAQESENFGLEQERLSGIAGVKVRISSLTAPKGLGIELLEYVEPHQGRPIPTDTRPNDLWCWQTTVMVEDAIDLHRSYANAKFQQPPAQQVSASQAALGLLVQDPDGHQIRLVDPSKKSTVNHY
jgi:catechol 2,3-dioxygenase-like lactoylglutathione lyase family enzyme